MAKFLNTSGAYAQIEEIITKAETKLVLITPYIKMPQALLERIQDKALHNVKVTVVCREEDLKPDEKAGLNRIKSLDLRFLEKLHAKCFYNESSMVITSLNLYETSTQNREMGILLTTKDDLTVFEEARNEAEFIIRMAPIDTSRVPRQTPISSPQASEKRGAYFAEKKNQPQGKSFLEQAASVIGGLVSNREGHCIRCGNGIELNPSKPLCASCYEKWREYSNPEYPEKYCHDCGDRHKTTMNHPLCRACYKA